MSNLPDLDTGSAGFVAYWNAIDQGGVSSIDPEEVLTDGSVVQYTVYDNGVSGTTTLGNGRVANFRVKNDGWFVVFFPRGENFEIQQTDRDLVTGSYDIIHNWNVLDSGSTISPDALSRGIQSLQSNLSNSGSITFGYSDVGIYNYEYDNATTITCLAQSLSDGSSGTEHPEFSYTAETTRVYHALCGRAHSGGGNQYVNDIDGNRIANHQEYASVDIIAENQAPDPATSYSPEIYAKYTSDNARVANLIIWY